MLVLERQVGEEIVITVCDGVTEILITLQITNIRGDKVYLGWDAPKFVTIDRKEVHEAKKESKRA